MEMADRHVVFWKHQGRLEAVSRNRRRRWFGLAMTRLAPA
jgi:hypothetical protein